DALAQYRLEPLAQALRILRQPAGDVAGALGAKVAERHVQHAVIQPPADIIYREDRGLVRVVFLEELDDVAYDREARDEAQHRRDRPYRIGRKAVGDLPAPGHGPAHR